MSPKKAELPNDLRILLASFLFPDWEKEGDVPLPQTVAEPKCQTFIHLMHQRFRQYLADQPKGEILKLLKPRLPEQEIKQFVHNEYASELVSAKTLKRFYDNGHSSQATLDILQAFYLIHQANEEEAKRTYREISRVEGLYREFGMPSSNPGTFNESLVLIEANGKALTKFKNASGKEDIKYFKTRLIGTTGLLLSHEENDYVLIFYVYIGEVDKPDFLQAVHLYSSPTGNTVANLAIFQRIRGEEGRELTSEEQKEELQAFTPNRELEKFTPIEALHKMVASFPDINIGQNIQRFLYNRVSSISSLLDGKKPFNFGEKLAILPACNGNRAEFYEVQQGLTGRYHLYFNERFPSTDKQNESSRNDFFSSVGIAILDIKIDDITGQLVCQLTLKMNRSIEPFLTYKGKVVNDTLKDPSLLILSLYLSPSKHRYLHFLFNIVDDQKLIGCFNIAYKAQAELGAGIAIAVKQKMQDRQAEAKAEDASFFKGKNKLEDKIVHFLSRRNHSLLTTSGYSSLENYQTIRYWGIYRMYFLTGRESPKISMNILNIRPNGQVTLNNANNDIIRGQAEVSNATTLTLTLRDHENTRTGFCCIRVDNISPRRKKAAYYVGSYAGFSRSGDHTPVASQFFLEYVQESGEDSPENWDVLNKQLDEEKKNRTFEPPQKIRDIILKQKPTYRFERPVFQLDDL